DEIQGSLAFMLGIKPPTVFHLSSFALLQQLRLLDNPDMYLHFPRIRFLILSIFLFAIAGCVSKPPSAPVEPPVVEAPPPAAPEVLETKTGLASYYHPSLDGDETASGVPFDNTALMAAHPTYPFGTLVRVTNLEKAGAVVEVRITDRGPTAENTAEGVIIDLSGAAAEKLGMIIDGRVQVKVEVLEWGTDERS
ncbi:MAG: septal ring lytic transglycosylase RlpA family protein, partial [Pseudomonadota bacterium]